MNDMIAHKRTSDLAPPVEGFLIPKLNFADIQKNRESIFSELEIILDRVRIARDGIESLQSKVATLEQNEASLEKQIALADGAGVAALALGVERPHIKDDTKLSSLESELKKIRAELRETRAAVVVAPTLLPDLVAQLSSAISRASQTYPPIRDEAIAWVESAKRVVTRINSEIAALTHSIITLPQPVHLSPRDFQSIDADDLQNLSRQQQALDEAKRLVDALTPKDPVEPKISFDEIMRQNAHKNYEARISWEKARGIRS